MPRYVLILSGVGERARLVMGAALEPALGAASTVAVGGDGNREGGNDDWGALISDEGGSFRFRGELLISGATEPLGLGFA